MPGNHEDAIRILRATSWFGNASDDLVDQLATKLHYMEADDGYIFVQEGAEQNQFFIVQKGVLQRTKLHVDQNERENIQESMRHMEPSQVSAAVLKYSVPIDTVEGKGNVTGLLHNVRAGNKAFATVSAKGPVQVWAMKGEDFRAVFSSKVEFMWQIMDAMANELRSGSKSIRTLMKSLRTNQRKHQGQDGNDDEQEGRDLLRVLVYDTTSWVSDAFQPAIEAFNKSQKGDQDFHLDVEYTSERLGPQSATYAAGYEAICTFVNDTADADTMQTLSRLGVKMIAQRAAGFDRIDTKAARAYGMTVARVPAYSPYAVAEMATALLMAVNRKTSKADNRVKMGNFSLDAGLMGMGTYSIRTI